MKTFFLGLLLFLTSHVYGQLTQTELAGNGLLDYPYFEFIKAINANDNVEVAIDPTRFPAIVGQTCDIYVVAAKTTAEWSADPTLTDITPGGALTVTISGANIQSNTWEVAAPNQLSADAGLGLGVGYDVILDFNQDGVLNGTDFIDGRNNESGFYKVHDTTLPGPEGVTELDYNLNVTIATTYGIPLTQTAQNLFFPTDVAGVLAETNEKLPLVIVSHGNTHIYHIYDHIGMYLASYGYVVMSHANNTAPGPVSASTTTLGHTDALIDQIAAGAIPGAGALTGNVDTNRIVWIGHSRGGEGVVVAYDRMFDGSYSPINFDMSDIKLISSMLPTDFQAFDPKPADIPSSSIADPNDVNYHLWTASGDSDVNGGAAFSAAQTYHIHDRGIGNRQSTTVQGVGHSWFHNGGGFPYIDGNCQLDQPTTHSILLGHMLPLVKRYVNDNIPSLDFLTRQYESFRPMGVPSGNVCIQVSHEYYDATANTSFNAQKTVVIDDYQSQNSPIVSSSGEAVSYTVENLMEDRLDDNNSDFTWVVTDPFNGATQAGATDVSRGVVFDWTGNDLYYEWALPISERDLTDNLYLSFRGAQGTQHPNTLAYLGDLTFSVTLRDGQSNPVSSSINIGAYGGGFEQPYDRAAGWHNEMETIRIRLTDFLNNGSGLDLSDVVAIRLDVGPSYGSPEGRIVIDDLVLSNDRAVYDARDNGDPHIQTVDGTYYDFHGAGEYVLLRDGLDYEIQVRQTPVNTANPLPNGYTGLTSCVAVNTAFAAKVGNYRISYQPDGPVDEQATRMRLRVNGVVEDLDQGPIYLGSSGRISKSASGNGVEVDFPNGSTLLVTTGWWSSHEIAFLNLNVLNTPATEGIAGYIEPGQWLPALADGTYLGPKPVDLSERYVDLNQLFSDSWRVNDASSLFDYDHGTSTDTYTIQGWPFENATSCRVADKAFAEGIDRKEAAQACEGIVDKSNRENCIADIVLTGETEFAQTYLSAQKLRIAGTKTELYVEEREPKFGDGLVFVAVVKRTLTGLSLIEHQKKTGESTGRVQFYLNNEPIGRPVSLDDFGRARWKSTELEKGAHKIRAKFIPEKNNPDDLPSESLVLIYDVR